MGLPLLRRHFMRSMQLALVGQVLLLLAALFPFLVSWELDFLLSHLLSAFAACSAWVRAAVQGPKPMGAAQQSPSSAGSWGL